MTSDRARDLASYVYYAGIVSGAVFLCIVPLGKSGEVATQVWMLVLAQMLGCIGLSLDPRRRSPWRKSLAAMSLCLLLTGCPFSALVRERIPAQCEPIGFQECKSQARWDGDPTDPKAWDQLAGETLPASREETRQCEVRRKALEQCLKRLERQHVIDLGGAK